MKYEAISWEGALIGPETLDALRDDTHLKGQKPGDFGLKGKLRDEILSAWAEARAQWQVFKLRRDKEDAKDVYGTTRTRSGWMLPFLSLLGYELETAPAEEIGGRSFALSHRAAGYACPVHIVGFNESLDRRRENPAGGGPGFGGRAAALSPHSLVQEYINLTESLYALVSNGLSLRLLRDSSRLVKLTYLEFNLERMFEEELFADFALLFRLLHISRWPRQADSAAECLLEVYHQDSLEKGSAIRERLSAAVKNAIEEHWANGLLNHPANGCLRDGLAAKTVSARDLYDALLTLVYRILFLLVIEERDLSHPPEASAELKSLYREYYSMAALRARCRQVRSGEGRYTDLWQTLVDCFSLYEDDERAALLGLKPLAGDLFGRAAFDLLRGLQLDNAAFARGLKLLDSYTDEQRGLPVRVNYAALNVEEFGSIYEGLLDYDAQVQPEGSRWRFAFVRGADRGKTGSHYTPEELVQPLIEHALQPLIEQCLAAPDAEERLLALKICDDACGSGHILLNAARRVALELARVRTKADNPDPVSYRKALRQVIEQCIYGVDANPQAVRLCKVALWLESHNPGESLGFLDHHIKCGDSLVGLTSAAELLEPIPESAYAARDGDDKNWAADLRKRHKKELAEAAVKQTILSWRSQVQDNVGTVVQLLQTIGAMPDSTPEQAEAKKAAYLHATGGTAWRRLKALADLKLSPFFCSKRPDAAVVTELGYRSFLNGDDDMEGHPAAALAEQVAAQRRFFHWFLEFAEVMQDGGFDCFLGNPPFLGGQKVSGSFGKDYLEYLKEAYAPARSIDIVGYFVRRNFSLLKDGRALGTLATNTLAQGGTREGSLAVIDQHGGSIVMAVRSRPWPGAAAVEVSLAAIYKGTWNGPRQLDGKTVQYVSTYFDDQLAIGEPYTLAANADKSFQGSIVLGQGFVLTPEQAQALIAKDRRNKDVLFPYLNGEDLNSRSDQSPSRWVINFQDWPLDRASAPAEYSGPVAADYPDCLETVERLVKPERDKLQAGDATARDRARRWWQFARQTMNLYRTIAPLQRVLVATQNPKHFSPHFSQSNTVFDQKLNVFCFSSSATFSIINSTIHFYWAWKYGSTLGSTLTYTPTTVFQTFPFPPSFEPNREPDIPLTPEQSAIQQRLETLGQALDSQRRELMLGLDIGLTKLYNLYHKAELSAAAISKEAKCDTAKADWALPLILKLRATHTAIDEAVRDAYLWHELPLQHGFHELEFLPENDRIRYTVSTAARKDILRSLLELNHQRHAEEVAAGLVDENGKVLKKKVASKAGKAGNAGKQKTADTGQGELF